MLALLGFGMVITFMVLIMTKRLSPQIALIIIPIVFGLIAGASSGIGKMMLDGVTGIAATGIMLIFGILYFGIMIDVGLFDPLVANILQTVKGDPLKVIVGTALLALMVSLDGDGATTYMIVVAAMLPLYRKLGINPLILTTVIMLSGGVMNILPWGGPTARVMSALKLDSSQVFLPVVATMVAGALWVLFVAYLFGKKERKRLGISELQFGATAQPSGIADESDGNKRPKLIWVNLLLTLALMVALVINVLPLAILFMIAFALALIINYPKLEDQRQRLSAHAGNALSVASMVFAAGIFTGILSGTHMVDAMAKSFVHIIPASLGPNMPVITAIISMPFTFFISNDAFYFGILPLITEAASHFGISAAEMGRASLLGQPVHLLSPLVPSTYLLVGLAGVNFGDHQRFTLKWAIGTTVVMLLFSLITAAVKLRLF
jgi:CitMHS family citrate-Mg2+:H+ or citrate-Ca2+:H+ symporter